MARRRFFVDAVRGGQAELRGEDARHLSRVLRAEAGRQYEISDNQSVYLAEIESVQKDRVLFRILELLDAPEAPCQLTLAAALFKFDRFEWMLEKATELGVARIIPTVTERCEKGLDRAAEKRLDRWRRILLESSQQARRARIPEITGPEALPKLLRQESTLRYFLDEKPGTPPILSALPAQRTRSGSVSIVAGPEGGWTEMERSRIIEAGWTAVSLGPLILRAETAAIAALAVLGSAWCVTEQTRL
jgi:16S rRNA (uracil1498-N3)-methyltransferase